jgi:hypothetical protein
MLHANRAAGEPYARAIVGCCWGGAIRAQLQRPVPVVNNTSPNFTAAVMRGPHPIDFVHFLL